MKTKSVLSWRGLKPEDLIVIDFNGKRVDGVSNERSAVREWPIHARIYVARPDVQCVLHAHPSASTLMGALGIAVEPLDQDCAAFAGRDGHPEPTVPRPPIPTFPGCFRPDVCGCRTAVGPRSRPRQAPVHAVPASAPVDRYATASLLRDRSRACPCETSTPGAFQFHARPSSATPYSLQSDSPQSDSPQSDSPQPMPLLLKPVARPARSPARRAGTSPVRAPTAAVHPP